MKPLPFVITNQAVSDLEEIWLYTVNQWSVAQADRYYQLVIDEIAHICQYPETGRTIDEIRKGYRVVKVKSHLLFYRVSRGKIEVVRILHERMDINHGLKK